ncbi:MAG: hypothetical protein HY832_00045 [Candidatus Aenigmarchaeota archaeon]|nr:hypothetical protein [Candidatus Aenigmarchaeota archaeon]
MKHNKGFSPLTFVVVLVGILITVSILFTLFHYSLGTDFVIAAKDFINRIIYVQTT